MKRILVCTDGSTCAQVCGQYAAWLAGRTGCGVDLLYLTDIRQFEVPLIADLGGSLGIEPYEDIMSQLQKFERQKAQVIEETSRSMFEAYDPPVQVRFHHRTGLLVDALEEFEPQVELILLGKRGERADFASEHLGSTMERVIRASRRPCLVTSREFRDVKRVVLAYDGGASCRGAVEFLSSSEVIKGLELHIVVVDAGRRGTSAGERLEDAAQAFRSAGMDPVVRIIQGDVEKRIAGYVEKEGMDLLAMGAYGHSRIRYLLIGSTTTDMIRSCHIPVLCFR